MTGHRHHSSRRRAATGLLTALALLVAACGGSTSGSSGSSASTDTAATGNDAAAAPATKGGTLRFVIASTPSNFDPSTSQDNQSIAIWNSWWEYLVKPNAARTGYDPMLASAFTVSPDLKTFSFTLRPGVTFSDGEPLTGADVLYSLNRTIDNPVSLLNSLKTRIASLTAPAPDKIELVMTEASPNLLADLSGASAAIYPQAAVEKAGEAAFFAAPVGTGPFILSASTAGTSYTVTKNPKYWDTTHAAVLDSIEFTVVSDDTARATAVQGGRADVAEGPPANQLAALAKTSGLRTASYPSAQVELLALNTRTAPLDNQKVRQAISLAVNRPGLVKAALFNAGRPATTFLVAPPEQTHQNSALDLYPYDLDKAKQLLTESGVTTPISIDFGLSTGSTQDAILTILQADMAKVGINLQPVRKDAASTDNDITGKTFTMSTTFWGNLTANPSVQPLFWTDPDYCCDAYFTGLNNPDTVALARKATSETDPAKVQARYDDLQRAVAKDSAVIPLYYPDLNYVMTESVAGFTVAPNLTYPWAQIGFR